MQAQIQKLSQERDQYIALEQKRLAATGKADSFDEKVNAAIRTQAAKKGIDYSVK